MRYVKAYFEMFGLLLAFFSVVYTALSLCLNQALPVLAIYFALNTVVVSLVGPFTERRTQ